MFLFLNTIYFHLWFLCKCDLHIACMHIIRKTWEIIRIKHFSSQEHDFIFRIFPQVLN